MTAATAAAEAGGFHSSGELPWAEVREHMWAVSWTPEQAWGAAARCRSLVGRMHADAERYGTFQYWR